MVQEKMEGMEDPRDVAVEELREAEGEWGRERLGDAQASVGALRDILPNLSRIFVN